MLARQRKLSSPVVINSALQILLDQDYIGRKYNNSYKLQGKGASYYLAPKALKVLRDNHGFNETILHTMYKNRTVSETFIDHCLDVFRAFLELSSVYPETANIYTKYELGGLDYFPSPAPDLYISRIDASKNAQADFFLDIFTNTQLFVIKKRIALYLEHYESGDWESETKTNYPTLLIACPDGRTEEKLQDYVEKALEGAGIDDLRIYTTTAKALLSLSGNGPANWTKTSDPEKMLGLNNL